MMTSQNFESRMNALAVLAGSSETNILFSELVDEVVADVCVDFTSDHITLAGRIGAIQGILKTQENWLKDQKTRLIASAMTTTSYPSFQ